MTEQASNIEDFEVTSVEDFNTLLNILLDIVRPGTLDETKITPLVEVLLTAMDKLSSVQNFLWEQVTVVIGEAKYRRRRLQDEYRFIVASPVVNPMQIEEDDSIVTLSHKFSQDNKELARTIVLALSANMLCRIEDRRPPNRNGNSEA